MGDYANFVAPCDRAGAYTLTGEGGGERGRRRFISHFLNADDVNERPARGSIGLV